MTSAARIDVHHHVLPPEFLSALERHGLMHAAPVTWTAEGALAKMDDFEIATAILSLSAPGPYFGDDAEARWICRQVNEGVAELVKDRPDRFGMFASVPLPDVDGAVEAIAYAYDELRTDGVILLANNQGTYIGDPVFEPVMAELDRRSALVLLHPTYLELPAIPGIVPPVVDFLLDTTRAAVNLVYNGVLRRYPNLRIILSHAGGFLPYAAHRVGVLANVSRGLDTTTVLEDLASFYFDTAMSGSPTVLPSLIAFAGIERVLFGTDWPYARGTSVEYFTDNLDRYDGLNPAEHHAINRGNAESLIPRLIPQSTVKA